VRNDQLYRMLLLSGKKQLSSERPGIILEPTLWFVFDFTLTCEEGPIISHY
jgi:hypothetical protein